MFLTDLGLFILGGVCGDIKRIMKKVQRTTPTENKNFYFQKAGRHTLILDKNDSVRSWKKNIILHVFIIKAVSLITVVDSVILC